MRINTSIINKESDQKCNCDQALELLAIIKSAVDLLDMGDLISTQVMLKNTLQKSGDVQKGTK